MMAPHQPLHGDHECRVQGWHLCERASPPCSAECIMHQQFGWGRQQQQRAQASSQLESLQLEAWRWKVGHPKGNNTAAPAKVQLGMKPQRGQTSRPLKPIGIWQLRCSYDAATMQLRCSYDAAPMPPQVAGGCPMLGGQQAARLAASTALPGAARRACIRAPAPPLASGSAMHAVLRMQLQAGWPAYALW